MLREKHGKAHADFGIVAGDQVSRSIVDRTSDGRYRIIESFGPATEYLTKPSVRKVE